MIKIKRVILLCITFLSLAINLSATERGDYEEMKATFDWYPIMEAIITVESGGNSKAKRGASVGAMQITPILVAECNAILKRRNSKKRYRLSDRFSLVKSKEMFLLMQSYHNPLCDVEKAIRSWNGGINFSIKRTQRYYEKVMQILNDKT